MFPEKVTERLRTASVRLGENDTKAFSSNICGNDWDRFIEKWAGISYGFVKAALGGYHTEPLPTILSIQDPDHTAGANASFNMATGQICLCPSVVQNQPGITLEKLTHELTHGALAGFPEGDPFYEEGWVDYSVWVMAHAPVWGEHRRAMVEAAAFNIKCRRDRALRDLSDYDRKRWAGGLFCSTMHGPWIVSKLKMRKAEGDLRW